MREQMTGKPFSQVGLISYVVQPMRKVPSQSLVLYGSSIVAHTSILPSLPILALNVSRTFSLTILAGLTVGKRAVLYTSNERFRSTSVGSGAVGFLSFRV